MKKLFKLLLLVTALLLLPSNSEILSKKEVFNVTQTELSAESRASRRELQNIVVFIEFSDSDTNTTHHLDDEQSVKNAEAIYNSDEFEMLTVNGLIKVPSFKTYYERESYGQLYISTDIFPKENGKVQSFRDDKPIGYYLKYDAKNPIGYKTREEANEREAALVDKATAYISNQISAHGFTDKDLDTNNDGLIDAISFIVEGADSLPVSITWQDLLWAHKSSNKGNISSKILNKSIGDYNFMYAGDYTESVNLFSLNRGKYGTIIHEFGHTLGFSDLYRYGDSMMQKPVGFYDVMGNVIGSNPQHFLTYFISEFNQETNWHTPLPIINKTTNSITLNKPKYIDNSEARAIKIQPDANKSEYFIVEYHEKHNTYDFSSSDKSGIIVYRVNEKNKYMGNAQSGNGGEKDHIFVFRPGENKLGEGAGNLSEATLNMSRKTLGKTSITNGVFDNQTIYYADGSNSRIAIEVTGETTDSITFNVTLPETVGTGTSNDPYIISDTEDFMYLMSLDTKGKYYKLGSDIDFKDIENYPSINFEGNLDGNNKTLKNITSKGAGVFSSVGVYGSKTEIKNLFVENITATPDKGDYLGGFASTTSNTTLKNIHLKSGTVTNIEYSGSFSSDLASTGGFVGNASNDTYIEDCSSKVSVNSPKNAGGFIGLNMNAIIKNSFTQGKVNGNSNTGAFIALQHIMDTYYNIPVNVYYETTVNNSMQPVGGYASLHKLDVLNENSLSKGIVGVGVLKEIDMKMGEIFTYSIESNPTTVLNYNVLVENSDVIEYQNSVLRGLKTGVSNVHADLVIGSNSMRLTSKITVTNVSSSTLNEADVLNYLGLTKKDGYVAGFSLNTNIKDLRNKLSSLQGVTLKSFKSANNAEIYEGLIATAMKFTLHFNNTDYSYTVVVKGDVNGDGYIYATDYVRIKNHIMGKTTLTGAYRLAADVNNDNSIYATDYVKIKNFIMGKGSISQTLF